MLMGLVIEYVALGISIVTTVAMFGLTATLAAVINRVTLDWIKLEARKQPGVAAVRRNRLLQDEVAEC